MGSSTGQLVLKSTEDCHSLLQLSSQLNDQHSHLYNAHDSSLEDVPRVAAENHRSVDSQRNGSAGSAVVGGG